MSEPTPSHPPGGQSTAKNSPATGGKLFAFLCWLALLSAIAVFAFVSFIRFEHRAEADRRHALADEQRTVAAAAANLPQDLAGASIPAASTVSALRTRSLELLARLPPEPATDLQAEWTRLVTALDAVDAEWERILEFRTELEALRGQGRALREGSARLADLLAGAQGGPLGRAQALAITSRQFAEEVDRASLTDPASLDRARALLEVHARVGGLPAAGTARQPAVTAPRAGRTPTLPTELAAVASQLDAAGERLDAVRRTAGALEPVSSELRRLAEGGARVLEILPDFVARSARAPAPALLGASLDAWRLRSAVLALAGLVGLFWWRRRLLRIEATGLDQAWAEAAESDWRARSLVRDLLRAVDSLDRNPARNPAKGAPMDNEFLEGRVREATASLPRIVIRRSQLAAALLSAREPLRKRLAAARDSVLAHPGPGPGDLDTTSLLELETTFREATLYAMATLVREIRAVASETDAAKTGEPSGSPAQAANGSETVHGVAARGLDLLERGLERVLAGEAEEHAALIFLLDDLRVVRGQAPFSSSLEFDPDLAPPAEAGSKEGAVLRADAARLLPTFRKGMAEWTAGDGDADADAGGDAATRLVRGSVSVLAHAAEEEMSPARSFWSVTAAFCTGLCERAIPAGPAVRRIMGEVAKEFEVTAEREGVPPPPDRLLRELLIYIALAESDHAELEAVRAAFELERHPLAIPGQPGGTGLAEGERETDISEEIIQQLEGIRAALDRIDGPSESGPRPPPSP